VTRGQAEETLKTLALGLAPDVAGHARLMERISVHTDAELLRDLLTEEGARALLEDLEARP
jgi:hypothetical protein